MRERPSCVIELRRFGVWRAAILVVALLAMAAMAGWGGLAVANPTADSALIAIVAALLALASAGLALSLMSVPAGTLAAAAGVWTFTFDRGGIERIESGSLVVALDLGAFLLLILTRRHGSNRLARRWLPVQRRGLETEWHALRCAAYSPPPATDAGTVAGPVAE
jgi:hypothetical protein